MTMSLNFVLQKYSTRFLYYTYYKPEFRKHFLNFVLQKSNCRNFVKNIIIQFVNLFIFVLQKSIMYYKKEEKMRNERGIVAEFCMSYAYDIQKSIRYTLLVFHFHLKFCSTGNRRCTGNRGVVV